MTTAEPKKIPKEALAALLRLEAKQVLYGFKSELFPDMTLLQARTIREMDEEQTEKYLLELGYVLSEDA